MESANLPGKTSPLTRMKTLVLIRHAKSSWENPAWDDFERPLNPRGKRDAPFMSKMTLHKGLIPDKLVSSPANRALTTARYFAKTLGIDRPEILEEPALYEASRQMVLHLIGLLSDQWNTVFMFGHNPTFTDVVNLFADRPLDNLPTCGMAVITSSTDQWKSFSPDTARLKGTYFPKDFK